MKKIVLGLVVATIVGLGLHLMLMAKADEISTVAYPAKGDKMLTLDRDVDKAIVIDETSIHDVAPNVREAKILIVYGETNKDGSAAKAAFFEANCITQEYYLHDAVALDEQGNPLYKVSSAPNFRKALDETPSGTYWEYLCKAKLQSAEATL